MFGTIASIIGAAATMAAGIGKKIKQSNEADMEQAEPPQFDTSDALGMIGEASNAFASMSARSGLRPKKPKI